MHSSLRVGHLEICLRDLGHRRRLFFRQLEPHTSPANPSLERIKDDALPRLFARARHRARLERVCIPRRGLFRDRRGHRNILRLWRGRNERQVVHRRLHARSPCLGWCHGQWRRQPRTVRDHVGRRSVPHPGGAWHTTEPLAPLEPPGPLPLPQPSPATIDRPSMLRRRTRPAR